MDQAQITLHHALADSETARKQCVRVAQETRLMLQDALHALHANRLEIVDEFLTRSIDKLGKVANG